MTSSNSKEFDIVVFGATGYTGEYVVEELANVLNGSTKKWAVAARNKNKLRSSLEKVQQYLENGIDITNIPLIEADVNDESSIEAMCKRTKLVLNCVGPYKLYGEVVVAACVKYGTHHVDLSGEIIYLETMTAKYFHSAEENHAYIIHPCGFDSIPADFGVAALKEKFPGDLDSVQIYASISGGPEGLVTNTGTWNSAVHSMSDVLCFWRHKNLLRSVYNKKVPFSKFGIPFRFPLFYSKEVDKWCVRNAAIDDRIVLRSQMFNSQFLNERPVHGQSYFQLPSLFSVVYSVVFLFAVILSFFSWGRNLLEKYPHIFSCGLFHKGGPTREQVKGGSTKFILIGKGWEEKLPETSDQHEEPPKKTMKLVISGPEPAYDFTSICMVHCGLTILEESDKIPLNGGVLTPGAAFAKTTLSERLQKRGISFEFSE